MAHTQLRMPLRYSARLTIPVLALLLIGGCDEAGDLVDDMTASVEESLASDSDASTGSVTDQSNGQTSSATNEAPQRDPAEVVAEFRALTPDRVSDGAVAGVAQIPEAAAMITEIETISPEFGAAGIQQLAKFENLESVTLNGLPLQPQELSQLSAVKSLKTIHISTTQADDAVVAALATLPALTSLDLSSTRISPAAAASFGQMAHLQDLDVRKTNTNDTLVNAISSLPIRSLDLAQTLISSASIPVISKFSTLEELDVSFTQVTGDAFGGFGRMKLKKLNVGETQFGIEGFANIKGMRELEDLNVYHSGLVQHRRCDVFTSFPNLRTLNAGGNSIADPGVEVFFKGHRSLERLKLDNNKTITDNGLRHLTGVKTLKFLELNGTGCTSQGARALKEYLPECEIYCRDGKF